MKKHIQWYITLVFVTCLHVVNSFAQNSNNLVVFSETGDRFYLVLNGLKYNQSPETNVKVTGLSAALYKATILFENGKPALEAKVHLVWKGKEVSNKEFSYIIEKKGEKYKLKFISQADIGGANANTANSVAYNSTGMAIPNAIANPGQGSTPQMNGTNQYAPTGCMAPMNEGTFKNLLASVNEQSFEEAKLKVAKQAVSLDCVSVSQIKRIMAVFSFEESKLNLAKYAYYYAYDKPNYFKLNDAFTNSTSVDDLNNYLNSKK
jgi:hypothetical protein